MPQFTPTEQRIMDVLADGQYHKKIDLIRLLPDDMQPISALDMYVVKIRRKINPIGQDLAVERRWNTSHIRLVRLLDLGE